MAPAVTVEGLRKSYGATVAVDDISFEVHEGEILGLLGPNGSGKTTTVECVQGLRRPDGGRIDVLGLDPVRQFRQLRRVVGSQLQDSALPDRIRVGEALRLFSSLSGGGRDWEQLLVDWGLEGRRRAAFGALSGGQRQRLFVALALVADPKVVVLDEMTTGLDPAARRVAWELIEAVRSRGATVLLVTHFLDEADRLCDRLVVVRDGRVVATGTAHELVSRHAGEAVVRFTAGERFDAAVLHAVPGRTSVERRGREMIVRGTGALLAHVGHALVSAGFAPHDLRADLPTLEDAYLALTGEAVGHGTDGRAGEAS